MSIERHPFNLVEIVLAVAVIAVGLSGLMVLFPVGLNASRAATDENCVTDAAEQFAAFLEARVRADRVEDWAASEFVLSLPTYVDEDEEFNASDFSNTAIPGVQKKAGSQIYLIQRFAGDGATVEFSTLVTIWREQMSVPTPGGGEYNIPWSDAVAICMRFDFPAEKPKPQRDSRFYRLELFNRDAVL